MQGGESANTPATGLPAPTSAKVLVGSDAAAPVPSPPVPGQTSATARARSAPVLPEGDAKAPTAMTAAGAQPTAGADTWYRSDHARTKSVRRRANPWHRRIGRALVALTVVGALGFGLYLGAREVQDYLERDRLPGAGAEVPVVRATSFQIRSSAPAPEVDGTLTIDTVSGAFEFVGRNSGPQSGVEAVSTGSSSVYIRVTDGEWRLAGADDPLSRDLNTAVRYLSDDDTSDAILTNRLRHGYVDLREQATEGLGDNEITRYELEIDTENFGDDYPLQWQEFRDKAIPGAQSTPMLSVIIWLDNDDVLVRVRAEQTNWSWERLTYADTPFTPVDPSTTLLDATTDSAEAGTDDGETDDG